MSETPAGWYPSEDGERYWNGSEWTEQTRPAGGGVAAPPPHGGPPPPKKKHTLRNVLLVVVLLGVLFVGGCFAILAAAVDSADKAIDDEKKNDTPTEVTEGKAFEHDGYSVADGWSVKSQQFGGATIKGMKVTLDDDQGVGGRAALLTFRLYDGKSVVAEIECSSNEMQEGETSPMDCFSADSSKLKQWDTVKVADAF